MRILFVGSVRFSRVCLDAVLSVGGNVVAVLSPKPSARGDREDLKPGALSNGIPFHRFQQIGDAETVSFIRQVAPDVIFVFGLSQLVPKTILDIPPRGCIGSHPTLLPLHRGRHPLIWTLVEGLTEGGLTFLYLSEGVDTGDILWQKSFPIAPEDDAEALYVKIENLARQAIAEFVPLLVENRAPRRSQDHARATVWRKRTEEDGEIDWAGPTMRAHNLIRALARPYPGAHTFWEGRILKIWGSRLRMCPGSSGPPGEVLSLSPEGVLVKTGDGALLLTSWSAEGQITPTPGIRLGRRKE